MKKLSTLKNTKEVVSKHGFRFSKSLGQNFLTDENIINKIVNGAEVEEDDCVIEIGPGIGTLTQYLCDRAKEVLCIEIDKALIPILKETLSDYDNVEVINEDVLKIDLKKVIEERFGDKPVKVVANLPYYITTPIIMRFLEEEINVDSIVVMVQKEVADRLQACPNTKAYGSLSVAVQYFCETDIVTIVPKHVFIPPPKIDSAVIRLKKMKQPAVKVSDKALFTKVVKASFAKRRKTLLNTLSYGNLGFSKEELKEILESAGIDPKRRGESLSIDEFALLTETVYNSKGK